jgi:hypothetical protein
LGRFPGAASAFARVAIRSLLDFDSPHAIVSHQVIRAECSE